ncbi:MAG: response regulator, partial [Thermodesulfobacteriota bacterium]
MIYILQGHAAFVRLLTVVLKEIQGLTCRFLRSEELDAAVESVRPDLMVLIEDSAEYERLRAWPALTGVPFLYVAISEMDLGRLPELAPGDKAWVMKNDPNDLGATLRGIMPPPGAKRILCLDDSPTVLKQIRKTFAGTPYTLYTAENGRQGVEMLAGVKPDLILTDVEMPVMNGLAFCREVRSRPETAELPIIILSSKVDYETIASGFESGADEYLTKPFFPDELLNKVESYLVPPPSRRKEHVLVVSASPNVTHQLRLAFEKQGFDVSVTT